MSKYSNITDAELVELIAINKRTLETAQLITDSARRRAVMRRTNTLIREIRAEQDRRKGK